MCMFHAVCDIDSFYRRNKCALLNSLSFWGAPFSFCASCFFSLALQQHIFYDFVVVVVAVCGVHVPTLSLPLSFFHSSSARASSSFFINNFFPFLLLFVALQFARKPSKKTKKKRETFISASFFFFSYDVREVVAKEKSFLCGVSKKRRGRRKNVQRENENPSAPLRMCITRIYVTIEMPSFCVLSSCMCNDSVLILKGWIIPERILILFSWHWRGDGIA